MKRSILIIDDEDLFREDLAVLLRRAGYEVFTACDAKSGLDVSQNKRPDIVLCDLSLPDRSGVDILSELRSVGPDTPVIMITAYGDMDTALGAFRMGAVDYLLKPVSQDELMRKIGGIDQHLKLQEEVARLRQIINQRQEMNALVGESPSLRTVKDLIRRVASADSPVLITGESGTGKEIVAREIHRRSARSDAPFLALNCGAIPDQLLESELFALEQKEFFRVGSSEAIPLKARILSSTNRNLPQLIEDKSFREDLLYRINIIEINVVPLRERIEDIPLLVDFFLRRLGEEMGRSAYRMSRESMDAFMSYNWPGNVRQLKNAIERALILSQSDTLEPSDFPQEICNKSNISETGALFDIENIRIATQRFERAFIENMIRKCEGNRELAAQHMGINPSTLYRKLSEADDKDPNDT